MTEGVSDGVDSQQLNQNEALFDHVISHTSHKLGEDHVPFLTDDVIVSLRNVTFVMISASCPNVQKS